VFRVPSETSPTTAQDALSGEQARGPRPASPQGPQFANAPVDHRNLEPDVYQAALDLLHQRFSTPALVVDQQPVTLPTFGQVEGQPAGRDDNCFQYAIDMTGDGDYPGFPGQFFNRHASPEQIAEQTSERGYLATMLIKDGFRHIETPDDRHPSENVVAAYYVDPQPGLGAEYHFSRLDADGQWSEKMEEAEPRRMANGPYEPSGDDQQLMGFFAFHKGQLLEQMYPEGRSDDSSANAEYEARLREIDGE